jgi:hypothetical protein
VIEVPTEELEKLIAGLSEENYAAVVKFAQYLSSQQQEDSLHSQDPQDVSKRIGAGKGLFTAPEDFDACNDEVATLFGAV